MNLRRFIVEFVEEFIRDKLQDLGLKLRTKPLVGFASTNNYLFKTIKNIHPWIAYPKELLPQAKTVIVIAVPITKEAIDDNARSPGVSKLWARVYVILNKILEGLGKELTNKLRFRGFRSIAINPSHEFDHELLRSKWSHRHAAFVAGLGTFGLHKLIIAEIGAAVRLSTIITEIYIEPNSLPGKELCLAKREEKCSTCIERCKVSALTNWDAYGETCMLDLLQKNAEYLMRTFGIYADICGKCVTNVPCSFQAP